MAYKDQNSASKTLAVSIDSYCFILKDKNPSNVVLNPLKEILMRIQSSEEPSYKLYELVTDVMKVHYCPLSTFLSFISPSCRM